MAKAPAKPEAAEQVPVVKSKKRLFIMIGLLVMVLAGGSAAAWFFMRPAPGAHHEENADPAKPPVFVILDSFTVNLTPDEDGGEKYLQVALTLQVAEEKDAEEIKLHMPQVRSRILLLLSSKKASELLIPEGKTKLTQEIVKEVNKPFYLKGEPQKVTNVFFTSFVIQ